MVSIVHIHIKLIDQSPLVNYFFLLSFNDLHVSSKVLLVFVDLFDVQMVLLVDFSQMMTVGNMWISVGYLLGFVTGLLEIGFVGLKQLDLQRAD